MLPSKRAPTHPGEILLKEFLEPSNITQKAFAEYLDWPYARLNEIINAKRGLTAELALSIAEAFKMEAEFWLNLQHDWELWQAQKHHKAVKPLKRRLRSEDLILKKLAKNTIIQKAAGRALISVFVNFLH